MLNKTICIKCINEYFKHQIWNAEPWDKMDESNWQNGTVDCCFEKEDWGIEDNPPASCPYALEHIVNVK